MDINFDEVFGPIFAAISEKNNERIVQELKRFPLSDIAQDDSDMLQAVFLKHAYENSNINGVRAIVSHFGECRSMITGLSSHMMVVMNKNLDDPTKKYVLKCHPEKLAIDYYIDLLNVHDDYRAPERLTELEKYLPRLDREELSQVKELLDDDDDNMRKFIEKELKKGSSPFWVKDIPYSMKIPDYSKVPNVNEAVEEILSKIKDEEGIKIEKDTKQIMAVQYQISTLPERIKMLRRPYDNLDDVDDTDLFREYGPLNSGTLRYNGNSACESFGGCRMFTCCEYVIEYDDLMTIDDHVEQKSWFSHECNLCGGYIAEKIDAVRKPLENEGWEDGCYCSAECLLKSAKGDPIVEMLCSRVIDQLRYIGIRKR